MYSNIRVLNLKCINLQGNQIPQLKCPYHRNRVLFLYVWSKLLWNHDQRPTVFLAHLLSQSIFPTFFSYLAFRILHWFGMLHSKYANFIHFISNDQPWYDFLLQGKRWHLWIALDRRGEAKPEENKQNNNETLRATPVLRSGKKTEIRASVLLAADRSTCEDGVCFPTFLATLSEDTWVNLG